RRVTLLPSTTRSGCVRAGTGGARPVRPCGRTTAATPCVSQLGEAMQLVKGVFKGGGAKGALYAGALQAVEEPGLWFSEVAGSSAGATHGAFADGAWRRTQ